MRNVILSFTLFILSLPGFAQCKWEQIDDALYATSTVGLGVGGQLATFSILKTGSSFAIKLIFVRGYPAIMEITPVHPLTFEFSNDSIIELFPISKSEKKSGNNIKYKKAFAGKDENEQIYPISAIQLAQLKEKTPKEINLHYQLKNKKIHYTMDGEHSQLLPFASQYQRLVMIINCALENKE